MERVEALAVVGWAATAAGEPAAPQLLVEGQVIDACVEAVHRQDVLDALKLSAGAALGFRIYIPPSVWCMPGRAPGAVALRLGERTMAVPMPADLDSAMGALREASDRGLASAVLARALLHARDVGLEALGSNNRGWVDRTVAERGGWNMVQAMADGVRFKLHGQVEGIDHAVIRGWAWIESAPEESVLLECDGSPVDCSVIRVERDDVRSALGAQRRRLGFEIEVPAGVWATSGKAEALALTVRVGGQALNLEPLRLSRHDLVGWLEKLRLDEASVLAEEAWAARQERQYRTLLLLEHVASSQLLASLSAAQQSFVWANAERFGVISVLGGGNPAAGPGARVAPEASRDLATLATWRLMREFNDALNRDGDRPLAALDEVLARGRASGAAAQRFLASVIPYFCGRLMYGELRPRLDAGRLRELAASNSAYELSLMLPEAVSAADMSLAETAMKRLSTATEGWLNTECIHQAIRIVVFSPDQATLRQPATVGFVDAFLATLEAMGERGYWSRLHDAHLMSALTAVMQAQPALLPGQAQWADDVAARRYALVPDFWRLLDRCVAPVGGWSPGLLAARADFDAAQAVLARPVDATAESRRAGLNALASLANRGNPDVRKVARELAMCGMGNRAAQPDASGEADWRVLLAGDTNEQLRLAAHPLAAPIPAHLREVHAEHIRGLVGVPRAPRARSLAALTASCMSGGGVGASDMELLFRTAPHVSGRENHYLGVRLACSAWLRSTEAGDSGACAARLVELHDLWFAALGDCTDRLHPPAALMSSASELAAAASLRDDDDLNRLIDEIRSALHRRYGSSADLALQSRCASPAIATGPAGYSTLVAIYSCERYLPSRVHAIRNTWAKDLSVLGIPWVVVAGGGDNQLHGDILRLAAPDDYESLPAKTLALIDWVYHHTRFEHLIKIDDDCHLAVQAYFAQAPYLAHHYHGRLLHRAVGGTDRVWHQGKSRSRRAAQSVDKTPEPSTYADGSSAYALSRYAMAQVAQALESTVGARLLRSAFLEDKLLGDLLATRGLQVSNEGHYTMIRRRFGPGALPVNAWDNLFYPSVASPTLVTHLDEHESIVAVEAGVSSGRLEPPRVWPTDAQVRLDFGATNQLELLCDPSRVEVFAGTPAIVVAVARNERVLMPHFLQHYRQLGITGFALVDNLSDDGTREYLAAQPDVVLYSADTEYKESHYGVSWQQAVLGAHAVGKWVILADIDEFLVYPGCEERGVGDWLGALERAGHDAARVLMVDMYPPGGMDDADFMHAAPFEMANCYDREPMLRWQLGSGSFSNSPTYLSALRHRLIPDSAPNIYTSQKLAVLRYQPWIRFSEGLHYASNVQVAPEPAWFAHFKYHAGFRRKVQVEVARKQHFNGAEEYRKYADMLAEARASLAEAGITATYGGSRTWAQ